MLTSERLGLKPLSADAFPRTLQALQSGVSEGVAPGFVVGVWEATDPDRAWAGAVGQRRLIPSPQPVAVDTVFDLASVGKVYATSTLTALLVDRGWLRWGTPVRSIFPQLAWRGMEIRHLLSHTAGFTDWSPYWERIRERVAPTPVYRIPVAERQRIARELVLATSPEKALEERALYSDISFLLLGFIIEEVTRMPLDRAVARLLWEPLGVERSAYHRVTASAENRLEDVAATEDSAWRGGVLQGQVHDDNCWAMGGYAGHAGVFADVRDVLHYVRRLFGGFLSRDTLRAMWTRVPMPVGCSRTLGWDTPSGDEPAAGSLFSASSVGHLGYTGTSLWIDPEASLAIVLLSNRVHPTRENIKIRKFRPLLHTAVREDLASFRR